MEQCCRVNLFRGRSTVVPGGPSFLITAPPTFKQFYKKFSYIQKILGKVSPAKYATQRGRRDKLLTKACYSNNNKKCTMSYYKKCLMQNHSYEAVSFLIQVHTYAEFGCKKGFTKFTLANFSRILLWWCFLSGKSCLFYFFLQQIVYFRIRLII